jgi:acyl-CoA thioesterase YciA
MSEAIVPGQPPSSDLTEWHLALRVLAMPADTNPWGDIFGGWLLSQADIAGATVAIARARGRVTTVAMQEFQFLSPVRVGDLVDLYARLLRVGTSSMTVEVGAWARRESLPEDGHQVAAGRLVYVAVDAAGRRRPVDDPDPETL